MKKSIYTLLFFCGILLFAVLLIVFSNAAQSAARFGLEICSDTIIPSLFPFFVLSSLLVSSGAALWLFRLCGRFMPILFGVSGAGALPLILGFVGGYPVGAKTVAELYTSGAISKKEAERLLIFTSNTGPAFILGAAGAAVFQSIVSGIILYLSHILAALLIGNGCRIFFGDISESGTIGYSAAELRPLKLFTKAVGDSLNSVLNVCAFVIIFSVFIGFFNEAGGTDAICAFLGRFGADSVKCRSVITGFFELSAGIASLKDISADITFAMPAAAFILGWGGLSVHCQALSFTTNAGLSSSRYFFGKLLHGLTAAAITWLLTAFSGIQPVFSFSGHDTVKSFIFDYMGLFYSAACAAAGFTLMLITSLANKKR